MAQELDAITVNYIEKSRTSLASVQRTIFMARTIQAMKNLLSRELVETLIMPLMNTQVGFKTDRGPRTKTPAYTWDIVRDCLIDAILMGFRPVGNEFNIIAENTMGVLNGWKRLCEEAKDPQGNPVTDLDVSAGPPSLVNGEPIIRVIATWKVNGIKAELRGATDGKGGCLYMLPSKGGFGGVDALRGKALRRAYKDIYQKITGTTATDADLDDSSATTSGSQSMTRVSLRPDAPNGAAGNTAPPATQLRISEATRKELGEELRQHGVQQEAIAHYLSHLGAKSLDDISQAVAEEWINNLRRESAGAAFDPDEQDKLKARDQAIADFHAAKSAADLDRIIQEVVPLQQWLGDEHWGQVYAAYQTAAERIETK